MTSICAHCAASEPQAPIMNPPVLPENGLVAYYTCDEGGGTTLHDSSGSGNHGQIIGGCAFVKHGDGYALKLDGATGEIDVGDSPSLRISGDLTIEAVKGNRFDAPP